MEHTNKFNLKESIEIWKSKLSQNSNLTIDNIHELESHLEDEIHGLEQLGLSTEEGLLIAQKRIGNIEELKTEFGKINQDVYFENMIIPYIKGALMLLAVMTMMESLTEVSILITYLLGIGVANLGLVTMVSLVFWTLFFLVFSWRRYKKGNFESLTSIPILVATIIVSYCFTILSFTFFPGSSNISNFGFLQMNLNIFRFLFAIIVLIGSCIIFYSARRENRMEATE